MVLYYASSKRVIWNMIVIKFTIDKLNCNELVIFRERNSHGMENAIGQYMNGYSFSILIYFDVSNTVTNKAISLKELILFDT